MTTPAPERLPTREECLAEGAPILARLFDKAYGVGCWRGPEPEDTATTSAESTQAGAA